MRAKSIDGDMTQPFRWAALLGISILAFTAFLDFTIVNTALPFIQKAFRSTVLELQWISNIFSIVLATTMIASGRFADLYGRKKVFYYGVTFFAIAACGTGLSPNMPFLIFFRGLQGLGASVLFISSAALITDAFPSEHHNKAIGIFSAITGLGLAIGPVAGGFLIQLLGWRWVFWVNLPLIAIGLALCQVNLKLPPHIKPNATIDKKGLALLIVGLGSLIYGIIHSASVGWGSIATWVFLVGGILVLALFIYSEKTCHDPLIDFSIFKEKMIVLSALSVCAAGVISYVFMFFDPLYLENIRRLSPMQIGLWIAAIPIAQVIISFFFDRLLNCFGIRNLLLFSTTAGFVAVLLHNFIGAKTPLPLLIIPFAILGINWGISNTGLISAVNQSVPSSKVGQAIGSVATIWNLIGSIFLAISTAIFHSKSDISFMTAFHSMVDFNTLFTLVVLALSLLVAFSSKKTA